MEAGIVACDAFRISSTDYSRANGIRSSAVCLFDNSRWGKDTRILLIQTPFRIVG